MGALRLLLGRWRADRALLLLLAVVVAATAALVGAVPRLLDVLERASLADELDRVTVDRRGVAADVTRPVRFDDTDESWSSLGEAGAELQAESMGAALGDVLSQPVPVVDSLRYSLGPAPGERPTDPFGRFLTVRTQLDLPPVEVVEGRSPDGLVDRLAVDTGEVDPAGEPVLVTLPVTRCS